MIRSIEKNDKVEFLKLNICKYNDMYWEVICVIDDNGKKYFVKTPGNLLVTCELDIYTGAEWTRDKNIMTNEGYVEVKRIVMVSFEDVSKWLYNSNV